MKLSLCFANLLWLGLPGQSQTCLDFSCDSLIVRETLDINGLSDISVSSVVNSPTPPNINRVTTLNLPGRNLSSLPESFGNLEQLQTLNLGENQINILPGNFGSLANLKTLDLNSNLLNELPASFASLQSLETVRLINNRFPAFPLPLALLTSVKTVEIQSNLIESLPPEIGNMKSLTHLSIWDNALSELPPEIGELESLMYLNVSSNELIQLPTQMANLPLVELQASDNFLDFLPPEIGYTQLRLLDLSNNKLATLPEEIGLLVNLENLLVGNNKITHLPTSLFALDKLVSRRSGAVSNIVVYTGGIHIGGNQLCSVGETMAEWVNTHSSYPGDWAELQTSDGSNPCTIEILEIVAPKSNSKFHFTWEKDGLKFEHLKQQSKIQIFNVRGLLIHESWVSPTVPFIVLGNLPTGFYHFQIDGEHPIGIAVK